MQTYLCISLILVVSFRGNSYSSQRGGINDSRGGGRGGYRNERGGSRVDRGGIIHGGGRNIDATETQQGPVRSVASTDRTSRERYDYFRTYCTPTLHYERATGFFL